MSDTGFYQAQSLPQQQTNFYPQQGNNIQKQAGIGHGPNTLSGKSPGVFPEDYFRCLKENKQISQNYQKAFKKKHDMALSRFENELNLASQMPGGAANNLVAGNPGLGPLAKRLMMDPDIDEKEALELIQLPAETLYLIDKVVRLKSRTGPIGINNSELINLEFEQEFRARHKAIFKLNKGESSLEDQDEERAIANGYIDEKGVHRFGIENDLRIFKQNEQLLQRLTNAVYNDQKMSKDRVKIVINSNQFNLSGQADRQNDVTNHTDIINISNVSGGNKNQVTKAEVNNLINQQVRGIGEQGHDEMLYEQNQFYQLGHNQKLTPAQLLEINDRALKISHEEWVRKKNHEIQLRAKLIIEAKRDLLETLVQRQEEEAIRMQERSQQMYEWENRKSLQFQHKKLINLQKKETERLEKQHRQEISYMKFKDWLKQSLIKQREDLVSKKMIRQEKKIKEEEEQRTKAHRRVMAKIAYKDWKQNKLEDEKLRKQQEKITRRQNLFDQPSQKGQSRIVTNNRVKSSRIIRSDQNSSKYGDTANKSQIKTLSSRGGPQQTNMLAYSLNKNIKNLKTSKEVSGGVSYQRSRPKTAGRVREQESGVGSSYPLRPNKSNPRQEQKMNYEFSIPQPQQIQHQPGSFGAQHSQFQQEAISQYQPQQFGQSSYSQNMVQQVPSQIYSNQFINQQIVQEDQIEEEEEENENPDHQEDQYRQDDYDFQEDQQEYEEQNEEGEYNQEGEYSEENQDEYAQNQENYNEQMIGEDGDEEQEIEIEMDENGNFINLTEQQRMYIQQMQQQMQEEEYDEEDGQQDGEQDDDDEQYIESQNFQRNGQEQLRK